MLRPIERLRRNDMYKRKNVRKAEVMMAMVHYVQCLAFSKA